MRTFVCICVCVCVCVFPHLITLLDLRNYPEYNNNNNNNKIDSDVEDNNDAGDDDDDDDVYHHRMMITILANQRPATIPCPNHLIVCQLFSLLLWASNVVKKP